MARGATIFKTTLHIADIGRHYYDELNLTVARHPSETDERMMVRLLAFALHGQAELQFGSGLSSDNEPDIWLKSLSGEIDLWIDVGLIDPRRIRKACHRATQVYIYSYGGHSAQLWWQQHADQLARYDNLTIIELARDSSAALAQMARRSMALQCTFDDDEICISDADHSVYIQHHTRCSSNTHRQAT